MKRGRRSRKEKRFGGDEVWPRVAWISQRQSPHQNHNSCHFQLPTTPHRKKKEENSQKPSRNVLALINTTKSLLILVFAPRSLLRPFCSRFSAPHLPIIAVLLKYPQEKAYCVLLARSSVRLGKKVGIVLGHNRFRSLLLEVVRGCRCREILGVVGGRWNASMRAKMIVGIVSCGR